MTYRDPTHVYVEDLTDGTSTVVKVHVVTDEYCFHGSGSSRRMQGDKVDVELGHLLALKRALDDVVAGLTAKANRLMTVNDKKAAEAKNYRTRAQWEAMQELARESAKAAHPAGKAVKMDKPKVKAKKTKTVKK